MRISITHYKIRGEVLICLSNPKKMAVRSKRGKTSPNIKHPVQLMDKMDIIKRRAEALDASALLCNQILLIS